MSWTILLHLDAGSLENSLYILSSDQWETQLCQMQQTDQINMAKILKINLPLEPQPMKVGEDLCTEPKQGNGLLK